MTKKICAISDIHGYLPDIKECDVLCICGDIIPLNIQRNVDLSIEWLQNDFHGWVKTIPVKQVVMTWGNHDFVGEKLYEDGITNMSEFIFGKNNNIHIFNNFLFFIDASYYFEKVFLYRAKASLITSTALSWSPSSLISTFLSSSSLYTLRKCCNSSKMCIGSSFKSL